MHLLALNGLKFRLALQATKTVHENGLKNQHVVPQCIGKCFATNGMTFQRSKRRCLTMNATLIRLEIPDFFTRSEKYETWQGVIISL